MHANYSYKHIYVFPSTYNDNSRWHHEDDHVDVTWASRGRSHVTVTFTESSRPRDLSPTPYYGVGSIVGGVYRVGY